MATHEEFSAPKPGNALAVFCRAPRLGAVKTRLAKTLGNTFALELYTAMLRDSFALGRSLAPEVETFACFTPSDAFEVEESLRALWDGPSIAQREGDLGARMLDCFRQLREQGYKKIAIIGSDSPDLPEARLRKAYELLDSYKVTVGESYDGGFYLIGASVLPPTDIFKGITWSSDDVMHHLLLNLKNSRLGVTARLLPSWHDVDDEKDLEALKHRLFTVGTHAPHTREFLSQQESPALD